MNKHEAYLVGREVVATLVTDGYLCPVGTRVRLTNRGIQNWGDQSDGTLGYVVESDYRPDFPYRVQWDNMHRYCYRSEDLEVVNE